VSILHPQLRGQLRHLLIRAIGTQKPASHAEFHDTLIVDGSTGAPAKRPSLDSCIDIHELGHALVLWISSVALAVMLPALVLGMTWVDVIEFLDLIGRALTMGALQ